MPSRVRMGIIIQRLTLASFDIPCSRIDLNPMVILRIIRETEIVLKKTDRNRASAEMAFV
jgi:hypothetical protein